VLGETEENITLVRITGVQSEITTGHLQNIRCSLLGGRNTDRKTENSKEFKEKGQKQRCNDRWNKKLGVN
jgi:hypothetical protein